MYRRSLLLRATGCLARVKPIFRRNSRGENFGAPSDMEAPVPSAQSQKPAVRPSQARTVGRGRTRARAIASKLRLIGDPTRLAVLQELRRGERCACDLIAALKIPQPLLSHHLRALRRVGLSRIGAVDGGRIILSHRGASTIWNASSMCSTPQPRPLDRIAHPEVEDESASWPTGLERRIGGRGHGTRRHRKRAFRQVLTARSTRGALGGTAFTVRRMAGRRKPARLRERCRFPRFGCDTHLDCRAHAERRAGGGATVHRARGLGTHHRTDADVGPAARAGKRGRRATANSSRTWPTPVLPSTTWLVR